MKTIVANLTSTLLMILLPVMPAAAQQDRCEEIRSGAFLGLGVRQVIRCGSIVVAELVPGERPTAWDAQKIMLAVMHARPELGVLTPIQVGPGIVSFTTK